MSLFHTKGWHKDRECGQTQRTAHENQPHKISLSNIWQRFLQVTQAHGKPNLLQIQQVFCSPAPHWGPLSLLLPSGKPRGSWAVLPPALTSAWWTPLRTSPASEGPNGTRTWPAGWCFPGPVPPWPHNWLPKGRDTEEKFDWSLSSTLSAGRYSCLAAPSQSVQDQTVWVRTFCIYRPQARAHVSLGLTSLFHPRATYLPQTWGCLSIQPPAPFRFLICIVGLQLPEGNLLWIRHWYTKNMSLFLVGKKPIVRPTPTTSNDVKRFLYQTSLLPLFKFKKK